MNRYGLGRDQRGFSLIDVTLALGLMGVILISIAGMFALGGRSVKSGRTASEALAVARTIVEELEGWGFHQTYRQFGLDGSATSYTVDTRVNAYASKWQPELEDKLALSYALITIESLGPNNPPPTLDSTLAIRVNVTVHWQERSRPRTAQLETVRM